jgi:hypothetical protein
MNNKYVFILSMEINKIFNSLLVFVLFNASTAVSNLYSNSLIGCCGLVNNESQKKNPAGPKPGFSNTGIPDFKNPNTGIPKKAPCNGKKSKFAGKNNFPSTLPKNIRGPEVSFRSNGINGFRGVSQNSCGRSVVRSNTPSSPALFYYAPRMKSIRVQSEPNIDGWEKSLREEMRLNGRSKHTVNRLVSRIQNYYEDSTISASDYAPGNEGYQPGPAARELAESRIRGSVESLAEFFKKSGNSEMDTSKSANGAMMMKGKLAFINTQLDKLGKPRVGMNDLREIVGMKINPPVQLPKPIEKINIPEVIVPAPPLPQIANQIEQPVEAIPNLDLADLGINQEDVINGKVDEIYLTFARWLADNGKKFPSLDPEVDNLTLRYFELVNRELRELGKFENLQIFRQKTLAHLDEVLDDRGLKLEPGDLEPNDQKDNDLDDDPLFRGDKPDSRAYIHLASLPGKVIHSKSSKNFQTGLPERKQKFDDSGNRITIRVMDNLPGRVIH